MTILSPHMQYANLARHEGLRLLSAHEAMVKGILETQVEVALVAGAPHGAFAPLFRLAAEPAGNQVLRQHGTRVVEVPDAVRAVAISRAAARAGRLAFALIANAQLDQSFDALVRARTDPLERGGALVIVLEDNPRGSPASCPRLASQRLSVPCLEPSDLSQLRDAMEDGLRLSRVERCPVTIVVHDLLLRSSDTVDVRPNRVGAVGDAVTGRRRRRGPRWTEGGGALRLGRRLELNRFRAMPSPGERVPVAFITIGPADGSLLHVTNALGLASRVPVLQLGLLNPVDDSAVGRMLARSQQVVVLEPRPGVVLTSILAIAESMRQKGETPATIWGRILPPDAEQRPFVLESDADLHPSVLVRKISHLLHTIRPTAQVVHQLTPDPPPVAEYPPPRGGQIGATAALGAIYRMLTDVDQWLRDRAPLEERGIQPTALSIDGTEPAGGVTRVVSVEVWDHSRFGREGLSAVIHTARSDRPAIFVICESAAEEIADLERLVRGVIPGEQADRVSLQSGNLNDRQALRDQLREAALQDHLTVLVVRDGPPAQFDIAAIARSLAEIDRLGFEPRQRLVQATDDLCAIRTASEDGEQAHDSRHPGPLRTEIVADTLSGRRGPKFRLKVRPLLEEVEVIRTRPPGHSWRRDQSSRPTTPQPIHARQTQWRAHLAGLRGDGPGVAAEVLCQAGRQMGYTVRCVHDSTPVAAGVHAWAQVLFTHPRLGEALPLFSALIPYGEADLLLGLDTAETLRAVGPDAALRVAFPERTCLVANIETATVARGGEPEPSQARISSALNIVTRSEHRMMENFAAACRTWFHTDRVADMALLGAAFQMGLIPLAPEAIEAAVESVAAQRFGRCREAFEFGRRLAVDRTLFERRTDNREMDVTRLSRRMTLSLSRGTWGGGALARQFSTLLEQNLEAMPGLAETDAGRQARRDFIVACHRCLIWGGLEFATRYAHLITELYRSDRGDTGRSLTRHAIVPLAEALLIRDPLFVACMAASAEQRQRTRQRLNVRTARGDLIERRYLTRFDLLAFGRRVRADIRTSDWPARAVAWSSRLVPKRWRGTRRERDLRDYIMACVKRAAAEAATDYARWNEAMIRLHNQSMDDRLRGMALAEARMLVGVESPPL